ncbi:hypothetical protein FNH22_10620 [Fulvivirga sp. M361]|uniref:hypothetical protein n=1 Tax=Fulvivirga sp. M361 TaxID=2594266 RepID=UPI00117B40C9|nr:hypothetical protein [Fulvivirga sp. M361]TRX59590.1 hypothetical protein FNH22_10620 [Fulvivirga sp. M361]
MKRFYLLSVLLLITAVISYSQDKIYKRDHSVIECVITEVGIEEIKYYLSPDEIRNSPTFSIPVSQVSRIVLSNGREMTFKDPLQDESLYSEDRSHALKLHFLSALTEHLGFTYEKSIKPGRSFETELGLIGIGFNTDDYNRSQGAYVSSGYKFIRTPDFYTSHMKYAHLLKGSYIKPQIILSVYQNEYDNDFFFGSGVTTRRIKRDVVAGALLLNFGKQIIYDNAFLIDYSVGIGYGFSNLKNDELDGGDVNDFRAFHYGFIAGDSNSPIAVNARLKIGLLLK